jgi:glycosyltransferase involved in cell wall biosynthesis
MSQAVKVGLFALVVLLVGAALVLRIEDVNVFGGPETSVFAVFDSVAGLDDKATVRIAGVRVGRVDGIGLEDRRARVRIALETPVTLTDGAFARIANLGLLGEKYIELEPGPEGGEPLADGAVIPGITPPGVRLHIVGSQTPSAIHALATDDIVVHGFVEDLDAMFQNVRVSVAPLRYGAGLKGKIAESLGHGVPCVSTTIGIEGSGLSDGGEILVADEAEAFADAVVRAYTDDALWDRLSSAGVAFVRERYSLDTHAERFRALFAELGVEVGATL